MSVKKLTVANTDDSLSVGSNRFRNLDKDITFGTPKITGTGTSRSFFFSQDCSTRSEPVLAL